MKIPATIELTIPDPDTPEPITHPVVCICPNDGTMVYKSWNGLYLEAKNHKPHTCLIDPQFRRETGLRP